MPKKSKRRTRRKFPSLSPLIKFFGGIEGLDLDLAQVRGERGRGQTGGTEGSRAQKNMGGLKKSGGTSRPQSGRGPFAPPPGDGRVKDP